MESPLRASTPLQPAHHRTDVQGLRGIAVLLVVLFHAGGLLPGGYVGVDVFFVVSGFVITMLLLRELDATHQLDLRRFYLRRLRRLLPALAIVTIATVAASILLLSPLGVQQQAARTALAATFFGANLLLIEDGGYFAPAEELNPFLHMWSLSVEEQFYLLLPINILAVWHLARRRSTRERRSVATFVAAATIISFLVSCALTYHSPVVGTGTARIAFYSAFTRAWEFGVGSLLALAAASISAIDRRVAAAAGCLGAVLLLVSALLIDDQTPFPGLAAVTPVAAAALIITAGASSTAVSRCFSVRPLRRLGDLSYSWYLWHWPAIVLLRNVAPGVGTWALLAAAFASLAPAYLSYRLVEEPVRRGRALRGLPPLRLAATLVTVPALAAAVLLIGPAHSWGSASLRDIARTQALTQLNRGSCPDRSSQGWCLFATDGEARGSVYFVGDSHAGALAPGVLNAARHLRAAFALNTEGGCLFLGGGYGTGPDCASWYKRTLAYIKAQPPEHLIIAGYTTGRLTGIDSGKEADLKIMDADGSLATSPRQALAMYEAGLRSMLNDLADLNIQIIIVSAVPDFEYGPARRLSLLNQNPSETVPRERVEERRAPVAMTEKRLATEYSFLRVLDPLPLLCDKATCAQTLDGALIYRDTDHVNQSGAQLFVDPLIDLLGSGVPEGGGGSPQLR